MIWSIIWFLMGLWLGYGLRRKLAFHLLNVIKMYQILDDKYLDEKSRNYQLKKEIEELHETMKKEIVNEVCKNCKYYTKSFMFNCNSKVIPSGFGMCLFEKNTTNPTKVDNESCSNFITKHPTSSGQGN